MNAHDEYALTVWLSDQMLALHGQLYEGRRDYDYIKGMMDAYQKVLHKIVNNKEDQRPHTRMVRE